MKKILIIISILLISSNIFSISYGKTSSSTISNDINILLLVPNNYGALLHQSKDVFESFGWNITLTGVYQDLNSLIIQMNLS